MVMIPQNPMRLFLCTLIFFACIAPVMAEPTPARVLVVYNSNYKVDSDANGVQDSLQVAQYYMQERGVPSQNILGVNCSITTTYQNYTKFYTEMILPLQSKINALGRTNIDVILFTYQIPHNYNARSVDNGLMALYSHTSTESSIWSVKYANPYFEPNPTFGTDKGRFDHTYKFQSNDMYLIARIDGPGDVVRMLNMIDQATYGQRYVSILPGYYNGIAYVDTRAIKGVYNDTMLMADPDVQNGYYSTYGAADVNIAYITHYLLNTTLPFKWHKATTIIGTANTTFHDGTNGAIAPRALFYGGWYAISNYLPVYEWLPGAFGSDLNSASLMSFRTGSWGGMAIKHGVTATSGVVAEPYVSGHPRSNVIIYYLLKGFTFAEASTLSYSYIAWMEMSIGDPLYAPFASKPQVKDTQIPAFAAGYPQLKQSENEGNVVHVIVNDKPEPEAVKVTVQYGKTTAYGNTASTPYYYRRHKFPIPDLDADTLYHYKVVITDPAGNKFETPDLTFTTQKQLPFNNTLQIPGNIRMLDFDKGGEGIAYHDLDTKNYVNGQPRNETGVDIGTTAPHYSITITYEQEWLEYTVNVAQTGEYIVQIMVNDLHGAGTFHLEMDRIDVSGPIQVPFTNKSYMNVNTRVNLTAGQHILRVAMDRNESNKQVGSFAWMNFTLASANTDTTAPVITNVVAQPDTNSSVISWITNELSDGKVFYGGLVASNMTMTTSHIIKLTGLLQNTTYTYKVSSRDAAGNEANSSTLSFVTRAQNVTSTIGDVNGDKNVDALDVQLALASIGSYSAAADIAPPFGIIDIFDVMAIVRNIR